MTIDLRLGDCLPIMPTLSGPFDMVLADLPYGTTACKWDTVIPFKPLWEQYKRLIKSKGAVVLFGSQPFTSALVMSNVEWFKYELIWHKTKATDFIMAKRKPRQRHENILVFCDGQATYNPQMSTGKPKAYKSTLPRTEKTGAWAIAKTPILNTGTRYPSSVQLFSNGNHGSVHPTQKPVALLEYLIKTYTNPGETVLDNVMGSGSTGVACVNTGRSFVGIEMDAGYFEIAETRISAAQAEIIQPVMPGMDQVTKL